MLTRIDYIFDPLCGWCYGAGPTIAQLAQLARESASANGRSIQLRLLPSGLFAGDGVRPMDDAFAAYAWTNDQRIERLTGQRFTQEYRRQVLADRQQRFDSAAATLALTAVALTSPQHELQALEAIQHARYVRGDDVTRTDLLATLLRELGLAAAAARVEQPNTPLADANRARINEARALMQEFGAHGVPTLIMERDGHRRMLRMDSAFADPKAFVDRLLTEAV